MEPITNPADEGSVHNPASSGDRPSTNCRYCAVKNEIPNTAKNPTALMASAALNAGRRSSPRSTIGSAARCCRRTKTVPTPTPAAKSTASV